MIESPPPDDSNIFPPYIEIILIVISIISSIISLLIPALYFIKRQCREHPTPLIAIISLLEALSNYNVILIAINIIKFQNLIDIKAIFDLFVFFRLPFAESETQFCEINFAIYIMLEFLSIGYNICFSADLLLTLKLPFFSGKKRMKFYHMFSILFAICGLFVSLNQDKKICENEFKNSSIYRIPVPFFASICIFQAISFIILAMSFQNQDKNPVRIKYIKLHRLILLILICIWAFPIATNTLILLGDEKSTAFKVCNLASFVFLLSSGGLINIARFANDPYMWHRIKKMICEWKIFQPSNDEDKEEQKKTDENDIWNLPLASVVTTFNHQQVVSNIIQIVVETCVESNYNVEESNEEGKATSARNSNLWFSAIHYKYHNTVYDNTELKNMIKQGTLDQLKKIAKITKNMEMVCVDSKGETEKNIFRTIGMAESYASNLSNSQNSKKQMKSITIKVNSFADPIFVALRLKDGLTSDQLLKTFDLAQNVENIRRARESLGASGSFFFFSYDNKLVIKTISESETQLFLQILPHYYNHVSQYPNSLLSRTYGIFSVQIAGISKINFVMMENTFEIFEESRVIYKKYDLKGSTIKRQVMSSSADVFKDINYLKSNDAFIFMKKPRKSELYEQIKMDIAMLSSHNIMDYSLLMGVGIYRSSMIRKNRQFQSGNSEQQIMVEEMSELDAKEDSCKQWRFFMDGSEYTGKIYSLSLIDYLQQFNFNKYMELTLKKIFKGGGDISSIDSKAYQKRFLQFVHRILVVDKN